MIAAVIGTGLFVVNSRGDESKPDATAAASGAPDEDAVPAVEEPEPEPVYADVDADSFDIELRGVREDHGRYDPGILRSRERQVGERVGRLPPPLREGRRPLVTPR